MLIFLLWVNIRLWPQFKLCWKFYGLQGPNSCTVKTPCVDCWGRDFRNKLADSNWHLDIVLWRIDVSAFIWFCSWIFLSVHRPTHCKNTIHWLSLSILLMLTSNGRYFFIIRNGSCSVFFLYFLLNLMSLYI